MSAGWQIAAIALLGARWLVPTEAPEQGRTLWIVVAWLALGAAWLWRCFRSRTPREKWDRWDFLICGLCGGYMLSAGQVLNEHIAGNERSALTMLWEWFGLAVAMLLCRRWFRDASLRQSLLVALASLVIALAGLGVWQHHVWYANLGRQLVEYESLSGRSDLTSVERQRLSDLRDELGPEVALLDSSGGASLRNRVLNSTEPVGRFALANTFAALLIFGIVVILWQSLSVTRAEWARSIALIAVCLLLGYVLLLTKSRSAWIGLLAAVGVAACCMISLRGERRWLRPVMTGIAVIGLLLAATWFTGGLDRLVFSEAGKSLRYRLEFWEATWGVIQEHPWSGTGPGNFRVNYLKYKLPGSSEEILDPHNLFLEVWAIGGIVPLLALAALLLGAAWSGVSQITRPQQPVSPQWSVALRGVAGAGLAPFLWNGLMGASWDMQLLAIVVAAMCVVGIWGLLNGGKATSALDHPVVISTLLAGLVVHLLTSGGIGMPGITQLVLLTGLFLVDGSRSASPSKASALAARFVNATGALVLAVTLLITVQTGLKPVVNATLLIQAGDVEALRNRGSEKAMQYYALACEADPLDPIPWNRRAQLLMSRWNTASPKSTRDRLLQQAAEFQGEALSLDQENPRLMFELGQMYWRAYERGDGHESAAVGFLLSAASGYPNSSLYQGTVSLALQAAGNDDEARLRAAHAVELDELNREAGHTDRYLPEEMQRKLLMLLEQTPRTPEGD